jgi:hypothetical protein
MIFIAKARGLSAVCKVMPVSTNIVFILASSNISKGRFQREDLSFIISISICNCTLQNSLCAAKFATRRAEDVVAQRMLCYRRGCFTQRMLLCRGCCHAKDVVTQRMLSCRGCCACKGCCRVEDDVAQRMLSRRGCCCTEDVVAHRMLSRRGCCHVGCCRAEDVVTEEVVAQRRHRMLLRRGCCRA